VSSATAGNAAPSSRARLLNATVEHFAQHGIGDTSLRSVAEAVGTSHRMLIYHFGSREGLLAEVTREVEARQRAALATTYDDAALSPLEAAMAYWELTAHAMQGKDHAAAFRDELVAGWLPSVAELCRAIGIPDDETDAHARLALAGARGLLLDLLVTGDRTEVTQAAELLNRLLLRSAEGAGAADR
jgi:AcrR family transcriptional regulator